MFVIPIQSYTTVEILLPICYEVLYPKVVHNERELDAVCDVVPKTCCMGNLVVSGGLGELLQLFVGQYARLWQAVDGFANFKVNEAIFRLFLYVSMLNNMFGEEVKRHLHIFELVKRSAEVEVFDVYTHKTCPFRTNDGVPYNLGCG